MFHLCLRPCWFGKSRVWVKISEISVSGSKSFLHVRLRLIANRIGNIWHRYSVPIRLVSYDTFWIWSFRPLPIYISLFGLLPNFSFFDFSNSIYYDHKLMRRNKKWSWHYFCFWIFWASLKSVQSSMVTSELRPAKNSNWAKTGPSKNQNIAKIVSSSSREM
jgi:hypothetical protein